MIEGRIDIIGKKLFFYLEEIRASKDKRVWYFIGFGILLFALIIFVY
jgi:hypothetical protein